jgi:hypothetical protein
VRSETLVCLQVKCPLLLSNFKQENVSTKYNEIPRYKISWKFVQRFSPSCYMRMDKTIREFFLTPFCTRQKWMVLGWYFKPPLPVGSHRYQNITNGRRVIRSYSVRISPEVPAILNKVFHRFPQTAYANAEIILVHRTRPQGASLQFLSFSLMTTILHIRN